MGKGDNPKSKTFNLSHRFDSDISYECLCIIKFIQRVVGKDKMRGESLINAIILRARMQDSIYHMILKSHFNTNFALKRHDFAIRKRNVFMDVNT